MRLTIPHNGKTRHIGEIRNGIFRRSVSLTAHLFKRLDAWGIDEVIFDGIIANQATTGIQFQETELGEYYRTTVAVYQQYGIRNMPEYKGHRPQIFLPRNYFTKLKFYTSEPTIISEPPLHVLQFIHPERFTDKQQTIFN